MSTFTSELVGWYVSVARDLPWRENKDPYRIWISEIMLQQTQVDTVIPYYHRFLGFFPTVHALAEAPTEQVLKAWEGPGYYSRARNLQRAAQEVVALYDGAMPADPVALKALPGIGDYTTGAIASIAFELPVAAVDGNVLRVVSRLAAWDADITKPAAKIAISRWVEDRFPERGFRGDFTQALMELGATVCTPTNPGCERCPVATHCQALAEGRVRELPVRSAKAKPRIETTLVAVIWDGDRVLIQRRPDTGLLAGMWEFPSVVPVPGDASEATLSLALGEFGLQVSLRAPLAAVQHTFTHIKMTYEAYTGRLVSGALIPTDARRWETLDGLAALPFSKAQHKLIAVIRDRTLLSAL
ncbi:MAG: A/G-specific adenine glycosylase [Candidatus Sericytochromatia bacterium]|nr:A/G-specific adenine glycosylase [Candidatus Sericytochromatia bacterium]